MGISVGSPPYESEETRENIKFLIEIITKLNTTIEKSNDEMAISSKKIEKYTWAILILTAILAIIAAFQIYISFFL